MGHSTSTSTQPTRDSLSRQSRVWRRLLILTLRFGIQTSSPPSALRLPVLLHPLFREAPPAEQQRPRTAPPVAVSLQTPPATRFLAFLRGCTSSYRSYWCYSEPWHTKRNTKAIVPDLSTNEPK